MTASEYFKTVTLIGFLYQSFLFPLPAPSPPFIPGKMPGYREQLLPDNLGILTICLLDNVWILEGDFDC